jgi:hypothetical protein
MLLLLLLSDIEPTNQDANKGKPNQPRNPPELLN